MSFITLYAENASVLSTHTERRDAVRGAVTIAMQRPDLSIEVGVAEIDDHTGLAIKPFVSASELLAANDPDAVAAADGFDFEHRTSQPDAA
jgi:hypothetical protein